LRGRSPLAFAGILIVALAAVLGFAAFTPSGEARAVDRYGPTEMPLAASGRVAAAVFASELAEEPPTTFALPPTSTTTTTTTTTTTQAPATEKATEEIAAATQSDEPSDNVDTTTTAAPRTTTTTRAPSPTTTQAPPPPTTTTTTTPPNDGGGPRPAENWRGLVSQYFPGDLVDEALSIIQCESKGDPSAYNSRSGASGLFQFIPGTWANVSPKAGWGGASPFDPEANVASAAWLVDYSIDHGQYRWYHWTCRP
jgi:soluble lytic murein transglycosylase-like protein